MNKSFGEILTDSVSAFKKSFLAALGICGIFVGLIIVVGIIAALIVGPQMFSGISNPSYIMAYLSSFAVLFIALIILYYIFYCWIILVVRNNALVGKSFFKESFFEAARKFLKVLFTGFLMTIVFVTIGFICYLIASKYAIIIMIPLTIIVAPSMFTIFYGVLCREGAFWEVLTDSLGLGFERWFRVVGYMLLFMICYVIVGIVLIGGTSFLFIKLNLPSVNALFNMIFEFALIFFSLCFATVFYLDLAGIKPQEKVEIEEEPVIHPAVEQKTEPTVNENTEPPHMDSLN